MEQKQQNNNQFPSLNRILLCSDDERLGQIVHIFQKYTIKGKVYEARSWPNFFRRIAGDAIAFYQNNGDLFSDDVTRDENQCKESESIIIHGNLHLGQFQYYHDELHNDQVFSVRRHNAVSGPFTFDLKRLATNLSLIAYFHGFSDIEIEEIVASFINQYVQTILSSHKVNFRRQYSSGSAQETQSKQRRFLKQHSTIVTSRVERKMHQINWHSINSVNSMIILAKKLATETAHLHCHHISMQVNIAENSEIIYRALYFDIQQEKLVNTIYSFAITYCKIANRDHQLFFQKFRNLRTYQDIHSLNVTEIPRQLIHIKRINILIIGGGIGGLTTALCFAKAGIRVKLFEKNPEIKEVGAGMQLAPNCSRILDQLGILKQVHKNAVFPKQIVWMDAMSGERLTCIDLGSKFVEKFGYPYMVVHRGDLLQALKDECLKTHLISFETSKQVIFIDERPKSIMIECDDGTRYDCDMVVGADGLRSISRKFVCDDGEPVSVGYVTYRGTVPIERVSKDAGLENVQFWIGVNMHLVQYPIRRGELFNQAAVFKSVRQPDDTDTWGTKEELNAYFSVGCSHVKSALELIQTNFRWPVYDRNPISKWSRGRLVLLGDAAHPMLQYAAQGAAQALEDAVSLVETYKKYGPAKIESIFREYEEERIDRSSRVVKLARDIGEFAHLSGDAKIARDEMLRTRDIYDYEFLQWLYGS